MKTACFYVMSVGEYPNGGGIEAEKVGTTYHPETRKIPFTTTRTTVPTFRRIFVVDAAQFKRPADLYRLDSVAFPKYLKRHGLSHLHVQTEQGAGQEFYWKLATIDIVDVIRTFLQQCGIRIVNELTVDPYPTRTTLSREERMSLVDEEDAIETVQKESLFRQFCNVFLPTSTPRRIQTELWDLFEQICETPEPLSYKGIVQWPTGTGKTIAMLMLFVIANERARRNGTTYRGLLVTVKNDVFRTISKHFAKLSAFGIDIYDGSEGRLSSVVLPMNRSILLFATRCALTYDGALERLPPMTHIHFDEVHGIAAEKFYERLVSQIDTWNTEIVTGTSATPETCSGSQRERLRALFGGTILHRCDVDEAVREKWIARPRFHVSVIEKNDGVLDAFSQALVDTIGKKKVGGKYIAYVETSKDDAMYVYKRLQTLVDPLRVYSALDGVRTDKEFCDAPVDSDPRILVACQRYQEGSDIHGLEMTCALVGDTISAHRMIQKAGRALRLDSPDKEGWFLIVRPSDPGTTEEDVLDSIVLDIVEFLGDRNVRTPNVMESIIRAYLGDLRINGMTTDIDTTIRRVQAAYVRKEYEGRTSKERYDLIRDLNKSMGLLSKSAYEASSDRHAKYINHPERYFDCWTNWYDFLGVDTSDFPQTKLDWVRVCKAMGIVSWEDYKQKCTASLPANPGEMYEDYTNWDQEFGTDEDIVW
jgi:superfamily II DNA or RNA helicase